MGTSFDGLTQDARHAVRALRASPGFTLAAITTLALGIAINSAVFAVTNAVLFKGFRAIEDDDRFAVTALLLASVGLYGVLAQSVGRRTQEIGIRMAIGGTASEIFRAICLQGMTYVAIGLIVGLAASLAVVRVLTSSLAQVSAADPISYVTASAILTLAGLLGCAIPARRAMRVDPVVALRQQ